MDKIDFKERVWDPGYNRGKDNFCRKFELITKNILSFTETWLIIFGEEGKENMRNYEEEKKN